MKSFTALPNSIRSFSFCMIAVLSLPDLRLLDEKLLLLDAFGAICAIGCIGYESDVCGLCVVLG